MRILVIKPLGGAFGFVTQGFINAFNSIGCTAKYWDGDLKEFEKFNPDLYIGASAFRHMPTANLRKNVKIAIHVNPFGTKLSPINGNNINENEDAKKWVKDQKPNCVFGYGYSDDKDTFWRDWTKIYGLPFVGLPTAGDTSQYYPDKKIVNYKVAYLGGRWGYKNKNIEYYLMPAIEKLGSNISIMGWGGWKGIKQYCGVLPYNDSGRVFLSSALVCPCICEPHTTVYGIDIPERFFKIALCGSLPILDSIAGFNRYCDKYLMADNPSQYYDLIKKYALDPNYINEGINIAKEIRLEVLKKHTYHHRMRDLCKCLGFNDIVTKFNEFLG